MEWGGSTCENTQDAAVPSTLNDGPFAVGSEKAPDLALLFTPSLPSCGSSGSGTFLAAVGPLPAQSLGARGPSASGPSPLASRWPEPWGPGSPGPVSFLSEPFRSGSRQGSLTEIHQRSLKDAKPFPRRTCAHEFHGTVAFGPSTKVYLYVEALSIERKDASSCSHCGSFVKHL